MLVAGVAGFLDDRWQALAGVGFAAVVLVVLLVNRLRRTGRKHGTPFVSGTLFTLMALGPVAAIVMFPVFQLPKPSGEHAVGVRTFELADASRPGLFNAPAGAPRRLLVRVWYPAGDTSGLRQRPYFSQRESETTARTLRDEHRGYGGFVLEHQGRKIALIVRQPTGSPPSQCSRQDQQSFHNVGGRSAFGAASGAETARVFTARQNGV